MSRHLHGMQSLDISCAISTLAGRLPVVGIACRARAISHKAQAAQRHQRHRCEAARLNASVNRVDCRNLAERTRKAGSVGSRAATYAMFESDYAKFQEVAVQAAQAAGQLIEQAFTEDKNIEFKGKLDLVTATDKECELTIFTAIREAFPDHKFIGEEGSAAQGFTNDLTDAPTW